MIEVSDLANVGIAVSAEWLYQHLSHPQLVVIDCRFSLMQPEAGRQQYLAGHIPGAYYLDLNQDLSSSFQPHGGRHPLPDAEQLAQKLGAIGVTTAPEQSFVVVYDDSRLGFAARLWWLMRYLGCDRVAVLDGGFSAWQAVGFPVSQDVPVAQPKQFTPKLRPEMVVDMDAVKANQAKAGTILVDSREAERYRGDREPIDPVAGHIPGAVNYPWQGVTDSAGKLLPASQQQERWAEVKPANEIIVYCGSGVTACVNLLSLELAGIEGAKLYAGSWSDWCSYPTNDVAKAPISETS